MFSRRSSTAKDSDSVQHDRLRSSSTSASRRSSIDSNKSNLSRWSRQTSIAGGHHHTIPSRSVTQTSLDQHALGEGRDIWRGHPGHLSDEQEGMLTELKNLLRTKGIYDEDGPNANGEGHGRGAIPEATLLRFLRARKFDVAGAAKQYEEFVHWRTDKGIDESYENYDVDEFETLRGVYPMWTGRRDTRGMPIYVYKISALTPSKLSTLIPDDAASSKAIAVITFVLIRFLLPFCSSLEREREEVPVSGTCSIIDVGGVGLSRFWGLRSHLQVASQVASANFPETIDRVFVVGAPSFFPTVFNWAKKWFDPGTVEKIHILSSDPLAHLLDHMPRENIPVEYGGDLDWTYGDAPRLGAVELAKLGEGEEKLVGPVAFDQQEGKVLRMGTVGGRKRTEGGGGGDGPPSNAKQLLEAQEGVVKPSSNDADPLMASFIPSNSTPTSLQHVSSPSAGQPEGAFHLPNGTSPASDPPQAPETGFVPGTHEPLTDERVRSRSLPPGEREEPEGDEGGREEGRKNEAVAKGWIPGSGVSEEEFLKGVEGVTI